MTDDEFKGSEGEQEDVYSFQNLPPKGSKAMNEMAARLARSFIEFARFLLNVQFRQARVFTDTSDLVFSCLQNALEDIRDEKLTVNGEQHLRALLKKRMGWFLQTRLDKERENRRRFVSFESLENVDPICRGSLEGDIEFVETLKVAMDALKNEDLKMFDVMTYVEQGMTIRQIEALTGIPKSTVAELRAKGLAKLRLFFDIT